MPQVVKSYVKRHSGNPLHPNIDDVSLASLLESQVVFQKQGISTTHSVIIRRAIRVYAAYLKKLTNIDQELVLLERAAKGVL